MAERYIELFNGEAGARDFLQTCEKGIPTSIRSNSLKVGRDELKKRLETKGFKLQKSKLTQSGIVVEEAPFSIGATTEYLLGYYYVQGIASMLAVEAIDAQPGELICDMCAAPGGKSTHLSEQMQNSGVLYAIDIDRVKIRALRSHISRMGITNSIMIRMDARRLDELGIKFDRILLDAPCTGDGRFPVDQTRRRSITLDEIKESARVQKELVETALKCLDNGGRLTYVTCSTAPEENELVLQKFIEEGQLRVEKGLPQIETRGLRRFRDMEFDESLEQAARLYPQVQETEGFFICNLRV